MAKKIPMPPQFTARSTHIHILGAGNIGKLLGHALRQQHPGTRITYILRHEDTVKKFHLHGNKIEIARNGEWTEQGFFESRVSNRKGQLIKNLIVATKCHHTFDALRSIRFRVNGFTSLCLVQNGMGILEEIDTLWKKTAQKPTWLMGIVSHGVFENSEWSATHAGIGEILMGSAYTTRVRPKLGGEVVKPKFIEKSLASCEPLNTKLVTPREIYIEQLRKVAVNSVINPLTTIFDCKNGDLFKSEPIMELMRRTIREMSPILTATAADRVSDGEGVYKNQLSAKSLEKLVWDVGAKTAENISSMRQDRQNGKATEIDYMNGYIARQGQARDLPIELTTRLMHLVKSDTTLEERDAPALLEQSSPLLAQIERASSSLTSASYSLWSSRPGDPAAVLRQGGKIQTSVQQMLDAQETRKRVRKEKLALRRGRKKSRLAGVPVDGGGLFFSRLIPSQNSKSKNRREGEAMTRLISFAEPQLKPKHKYGKHMAARQKKPERPVDVRTVTSMTGTTPLDLTKTFKFS